MRAQPSPIAGTSAAREKVSSFRHVAPPRFCPSAGDSTGLSQYDGRMKKDLWKPFSSVLAVAATVVIAVFANAHAQSLEEDMRRAAGAYEQKNYALAVSLWKPLADQGNAEAQTLLGAMYWQGEGVPRDHKEAARLYLLAAEQGYARAQYDIGFMYGFGEGIPPQDDVQACKWISLAIARFTVKNEDRRQQAIKDRATLTSRMSKDQLAEAEAAIRSWQPKQR